MIAFAGSCAAALAYIAVRKVGPSVSAFVLINYILIFTMLIACLPELLHDSYLPMAQKTIACTGLVMACINRFPGCWSTGRDRV